MRMRGGGVGRETERGNKKRDSEMRGREEQTIKRDTETQRKRGGKQSTSTQKYGVRGGL